MEITTIIKIKVIFLAGVALLNFLLALLIWRRGKTKATLHLGFVAFFSALFISVLAGGYFSWGISYQMFIFFARVSWVGVLILPGFITFLYYFFQKTRYLKIKSSLLYLIGIVIAILGSSTSLFFAEIPGYYVERTFLTGVKPGPLDPVGRIYILFCTIIILVNLLKYYFKTTGFKKLQIKYFILGIAIYVGGGIITVALVPLLFKTVVFVEVVAFLSFVWLILTGYAILKYRLLDIRVVLGKGAAYLFSLITAVAAGFLIVFINNQLLTPLSFNALVPFITLVGFLLFQLTKFYEKLAARYFYHTFYNTQMVLTGLGNELTQILELKPLSFLIVNTLKNTLKLERGAVLTREAEKGYLPRQMIGFQEKELLSLAQDAFFIQCLEKSKRALVREEISFLIKDTKREEDKQKLLGLQDKMEKLGVEICLPLVFEKEIIGITILGKKISGEAFSIQDLELLVNLSTQASIAFQNARFYSEVKEFSKKLEREKKITEAHKEIAEGRARKLEEWYQLTVGRELKMIELKKKIREIEEKLKKEKE